MVVALQPLLVGAIWLALIVITPSALFWVGLQIPKLVNAVRERRAARRPDEQPKGIPVEKLAADLRRLRAELVYRKPTTNLRLTALMEAYDDVLEATCARLELPSHLRELPIGRDRDIERLRTEAAIQEAGISLEVPGHRYGRPAPP
jgi:hypothetical protein